MTVMSIHLADIGLREASARRRATPNASLIDGCQWLERAVPIEFHRGRGPSRPHPSRVVMFAGWDDDAALDNWEAANGLPWNYRVRLEPVRIHGAWAPFDDIPAKDTVLADDDETAVVTLAYTKPLGFPRFGRFSGPAETASARAGATSILLGALGLPRFAATFSLWRSKADMLAFAHPPGGGPHRAAIDEGRRKTFHHEQAFIRCRPYRAEGDWPHASG